MDSWSTKASQPEVVLAFQRAIRAINQPGTWFKNDFRPSAYWATLEWNELKHCKYMNAK